MIHYVTGKFFFGTLKTSKEIRQLASKNPGRVPPLLPSSKARLLEFSVYLSLYVRHIIVERALFKLESD